MRDLGMDVWSPLSNLRGFNLETATEPSNHWRVNPWIAGTVPEIAFLTP